MTPDELRSLVDRATPGPWYFRDDDEGFPDVRDSDEWGGAIVAQGEGCFKPETEKANLRLIALAPSLAREVADLREWAERAAEQITAYREEYLESCREFLHSDGPSAEESLRDFEAEHGGHLLAEYAEMQERL